MKLTGKCREAFEEWYFNSELGWYRFNEVNPINYNVNEIDFCCTPESMQFGVLVDFFNSVKIDIEIERVNSECFIYNIYNDFIKPCNLGSKIEKQTRPEARLKAIEKANEIYNSNI